MGKFEDLTGQKFGKLIVIEESERKSGRSAVKCLCDCGNVVSVITYNLVSGRTKSCGCYQKQQTSIANKVHGKSKTRIYREWLHMKERCYKESDQRYHRYGGRGITVCVDWMNDFQAFYDYVSNLLHYGEKGYTLDRINNDGNYAPGNVRWATAKEQANNRSTNKKRKE